MVDSCAVQTWEDAKISFPNLPALLIHKHAKQLEFYAKEKECKHSINRRS
jgi:hypothetical protein